MSTPDVADDAAVPAVPAPRGTAPEAEAFATMDAGAPSEVIRVASDRCGGCNACVRRCPARANRVQRGRTDVAHERCIGCGRCVRACTRGARTFAPRLPHALAILSSGRVVAMVAPSFPAAFEARPGQIVAALRRLGFGGVYEVAFGADIVSRRYTALRNGTRMQAILSTPCAGAVEFVRRHAPDLLPWLAPVMSPMAAMGKLLKQRVQPGCRTIFAGPCVAKALEAQHPQVKPWVDATMTFSDIRQLFCDRKIDPHALEDEDFDPPHSYLGGVLPLSGGLASGAEAGTDLAENGVTTICGPEELVGLVQRLREQQQCDHLERLEQFEPQLYDVLLCRGCIGGPALLEQGDAESRLLASRDRIISYVRSRRSKMTRARWEDDLDRLADLDISRGFEPSRHSRTWPEDSPESMQNALQVQQVLARMGRHTPNDELDCGACGYATCRDKARAVCQGFDELEICLPQLIERLESATATLKRAEGDLCHAREQQQYAQRMKNLFVSMAAHEMKAPLGAVEGYLHLLGDGAYEGQPEKRRQVVGRCLERTHALLSFVHDLLEIARRDAAPESPAQCDPEPLDLGSLVEDVVAFHHEEIEACGLHVEVDIDPPLRAISVPLVLNRSDVERVLTNLVSNAIKYNRQAGSIVVRVRVSEGAVSLEVEDTGLGMTREEQRRLGEEFYRVKNSRTRLITGTGLGLALVKRIVEGCGGGLEIQSCPEVGSTFRVVLPIGKRPSPSSPSEIPS